MNYRRDNADYEAMRAESERVAKTLGYPIHSGLPRLDDSLVLRPQDEIASRALALLCVVVRAYGFSSDTNVREWIKSENLARHLTPDEEHFLYHGDQTKVTELKTREECLWAFAWVLGFHDSLEFGEYCQPTLSSFFPRFNEGETSEKFRSRCRLRPLSEILAKADLAYCLHWAIREGQLKQKRLKVAVHPYVVIERRHALEWMLSREHWDDVSLDT